MAKLSADEKRARALARSLVLRERGRGEFAGTREQLIAAGLAQPGDFPGDPECPCKVRHSFERDDRHFQVRAEFSRVSSAARWAAMEWLGGGSR